MDFSKVSTITDFGTLDRRSWWTLNSLWPQKAWMYLKTIKIRQMGIFEVCINYLFKKKRKHTHIYCILCTHDIKVSLGKGKKKITTPITPHQTTNNKRTTKKVLLMNNNIYRVKALSNPRLSLHHGSGLFSFEVHSWAGKAQSHPARRAKTDIIHWL